VIALRGSNFSITQLCTESNAEVGRICYPTLLAGADIITVPFGVLQKTIRSPFTDVGLERFLADWAKVAGR